MIGVTQDRNPEEQQQTPPWESEMSWERKQGLMEACKPAKEESSI